MSLEYPRAPSPRLWRGLAFSLSAIALATAAAAWSHVLEVARLGVICGTSPDLGHCWACYAAPILGLAAGFAAWQAGSWRAPMRDRRHRSSRTTAVRLGVVTVFASALSLADAGHAQPAMGSQPRHVARGQALAQDRCAACHALAGSEPSPDRRAPPFRRLSGQFVELTLHQRLTEIADTGHYDMPPVPVHSDEVRDLVAYINSLPPPALP